MIPNQSNEIFVARTRKQLHGTDRHNDSSHQNESEKNCLSQNEVFSEKKQVRPFLQKGLRRRIDKHVSTEKTVDVAKRCNEIGEDRRE